MWARRKARGATRAAAGGRGHAHSHTPPPLQVPSRSIAGMLLVRQGGPIKAITAEAIRALEQLWSRKVHLYLHVTVKEFLKRGGGG